MCRHLSFPDGTTAIICGGPKPKFCACGREANLLCDWKVKHKKSGTCDAPICSKHALRVAPDKDLCPMHQRAYEEWKQRHPGFVAPPDYAQLSLLTTPTPDRG